jgi:hypothetical protein
MGNKGQIHRHNVNRQSREDEERSRPHAPITMRSLPIWNRAVMVRWRMRPFVWVVMVPDFSHSFTCTASERTELCRTAHYIAMTPAAYAWSSPKRTYSVDDLVAFACGLLEAGTVLDGDMPARIGNQSCLLQYFCRDRNTAAARAQHRSQKLLCDCDAIDLHPVAAHQQPPGQPLAQLIWMKHRLGK